jgi:hypothetical protein
MSEQPPTDDSTRLVAEGIEPEDPQPIEYPDTTVGMLMRQRDEARASAKSDRLFAEQLTGRAEETDVRAARLDDAISALGGEPT